MKKHEKQHAFRQINEKKSKYTTNLYYLLLKSILSKIILKSP